MTIWLLLALLTIGPESPAVTTDHFAAIEINHFYDEQGKHVFDQIIYRDFAAVADWRLAKSADQLPTGRTAIWFDGHCLRKVSATSVYRTWTQFDRELVERAEHPKESRRELTSPRITKQRAQELIEHGRRNDHHPETP